jgi:hypothetical protein
MSGRFSKSLEGISKGLETCIAEVKRGNEALEKLNSRKAR